MAFLLPYEGLALGVSAAEGLAGIVAGVVAAIESHKPNRPSQDNDSPHAPDDDDDPGDDPPGGTTSDTDSYVQHAEVMDVSHANEVSGHWRAYQMRKIRRKFREGYYNLPEFLAMAAKRGIYGATAYHAYRNLIRTIREHRGIHVDHTPIATRSRRARQAGFASALGVPTRVARTLFPH